jgi:bacillithiol biosynthesis deacetylase BshB1
MKNIEKADVLVFAAHPDDAELGCGGSLIKLSKEGKRTVIVDATQSELSTRGTIELRQKEAKYAGEILKLYARENLNIHDGTISSAQENILKVVEQIRKWRPEIIIMPPQFERHPDHEEMHRLVRKAAFFSGLQKIETSYGGQKQEPHRAKKMFCFMQTYDFQPSFYIDISETLEEKVRAMKAFASQFHNPEEYHSDEPETFISRPGFLEMLESRARYFGEKIGVKYAEAFYSVEPIGIDSLSTFLKQND